VIQSLFVLALKTDVQRSTGQLTGPHPRFEFTEALDLGAFVDPSSAQDNPVTGYTLALVLAYVSVARGARHTFVRALPDRDVWNHLSDDASRPCTQREAVEGNFGGEEGRGQGQRLVHGLVYVRNDQLPPSSCPAKGSLKYLRSPTPARTYK
jgi:hypothetical protein